MGEKVFLGYTGIPALARCHQRHRIYGACQQVMTADYILCHPHGIDHTLPFDSITFTTPGPHTSPYNDSPHDNINGGTVSLDLYFYSALDDV